MTAEQQELFKKTMNSNIDQEIIDQLDSVYQQLKELGLKKIGGAFGAFDDPDEQKFFVMLDDYFRGIAQQKVINGPFVI